MYIPIYTCVFAKRTFRGCSKKKVHPGIRKEPQWSHRRGYLPAIRGARVDSRPAPLMRKPGRSASVRKPDFGHMEGDLCEHPEDVLYVTSQSDPLLMYICFERT